MVYMVFVTYTMASEVELVEDWACDATPVTLELPAAVVAVCATTVKVGWLETVATTLLASVVETATSVGVPSDAVAEQVAVRPTVNETRPSAARGSAVPAGRVPTYALKL